MLKNPHHPESPSVTPSALRMLGISTFLAIGLVGLFIAGGFAYQLRALARQSDPPQLTHGLVFPASAVVVNHDVDPDVVRLDGEATTQLDLPAADLPAFLAQLNIRQATTPVNPATYGTSRWVHAQYDCASAKGDALFVEVGNPTEATVRVRLYTNWN